MKLFVNSVLTLIIFVIFPIGVFANGEDHLPGTPHTEEATSIDPAVAVIVVVGFAILGFLLWKFVLNKKGASLQKPS